MIWTIKRVVAGCAVNWNCSHCQSTPQSDENQKRNNHKGQTTPIFRIVRKATKISHHIQATMNHFFHYMECFAAKLSELQKNPILPSGFAKKLSELLRSRFIIHKTFSSLKTQAHLDGSLFTGIPGKVIIIPPVLVSGFQTNFSS